MKTEYILQSSYVNYGYGAKFEVIFHKFNKVGIQTSETEHRNLSLSYVIINVVLLRTPSSILEHLNVSMRMCSKNALDLKKS